MGDVDLVNRDPNSLNDHIKVKTLFQKVIPSGTLNVQIKM